MKNDKITTHVEFLVNPEFTDEVLLNAVQTRDLILLEEGTEVFILTYKKEEPNTIVIFAIYTSKELYDWHLEQAYVKSFFNFLMGKLIGVPRVTYLESII